MDLHEAAVGVDFVDVRRLCGLHYVRGLFLLTCSLHTLSSESVSSGERLALLSSVYVLIAVLEQLTVGVRGLQS